MYQIERGVSIHVRVELIVLNIRANSDDMCESKYESKYVPKLKPYQDFFQKKIISDFFYLDQITQNSTMVTTDFSVFFSLSLRSTTNVSSLFLFLCIF